MSSKTINIARNIKWLREKNGDTQEEFGRRYGKERSTVAKWEAGTASPNIKIVTNMCLNNGINIEDFIYSDIEMGLHNPDMTHEESTLVDYFRRLNEEGQEKLLEHARLLLDSGQYIKNHAYEMVARKEG